MGRDYAAWMLMRVLAGLTRGWHLSHLHFILRQYRRHFCLPNPALCLSHQSCSWPIVDIANLLVLRANPGNATVAADWVVFGVLFTHGTKANHSAEESLHFPPWKRGRTAFCTVTKTVRSPPSDKEI